MWCDHGLYFTILKLIAQRKPVLLTCVTVPSVAFLARSNTDLELTCGKPQRRGACSGLSGAAMILAATAAVSCILVWRVNSVEIALLACSANCSSVKGSVASGGKRGSEPTPVVYSTSFNVLRHCLSAARLSEGIADEQ